MNKIQVTAGAVIAGALLLSAGSASAISYTLNSLNASGYPGPYGMVNVVLNSSTSATITFTSENGYLFVDGSSDAVNVNSSDFTAAILSDNAPAGLGAFSDFNSGQVSQWGNFNLTLDQNNTSPSDRASSISFTLTDLGGNTWTSDANVLDANGSGYTVAAHIIVPGGGFTGYAANGQTSNVPDGGSTAALLGAAVTAIGAVRRKLS